VAVIFDTCVIAFADGDEKLLRAIEDETELALPAIVLGEYCMEFRSRDFRATYESWLKAIFLLRSPLRRPRTGQRYAAIRHELKASGTPIPSNDLWIAAWRGINRMPLVTRDGHFRVVQGLRVLAW